MPHCYLRNLEVGQMGYQETSIAGLDVLQRKGPATADTAVILCHGFGANLQDLAPLVEMIHVPSEKGVNWYFPNGPLRSNPGMDDGGRAWFTLDLMQLHLAVSSGRTDALFPSEPSFFASSAERLSEMVETLSKTHSRILLGGFSQGAAMAAEVGVRSASVAALWLFSGVAIVAPSLREKIAKRAAPVPVFQSHGRQDPVLPFSVGLQLKQLFEDAGWPHVFHPFHGGHGIPPEVMQAMNSYNNQSTEPPLRR